MPNELGKTKQRLTRTRVLLKHIVEHMNPIYEEYVDEYPEFADMVFKVAAFAKDLDLFVEKTHEKLLTL